MVGFAFFSQVSDPVDFKPDPQQHATRARDMVLILDGRSELGAHVRSNLLLDLFKTFDFNKKMTYFP